MVGIVLPCWVRIPPRLERVQPRLVRDGLVFWLSAFPYSYPYSYLYSYLYSYPSGSKLGLF